MTSLFISLPKDIWCGKITQFLDLSEIVRVDTAIAKPGDNRTTYRQNINGCIIDRRVALGPSVSQEGIKGLNKHNISPARIAFQRGFDFEWFVANSGFVAQTTEIEFEAKSISNDEQFDQIMQLCAPRMILLSIWFCPKLSSDAFLRWIANSNNLTTCELTRFGQNTDAMIAAVTKLCPKLVDFKAIQFVTADVLKGFADFRSLLSFECHSTITSSDVATIARYMPHLENLKLMMGTGGGFSGVFPTLFHACPKIRCLHLFEFKQFSDDDLKAAATLLPDLRELHLYASPLLTYNGVLALANACPNLRVLGLENCPLIQNDAIIVLGSKCRFLTSLSVANCSLLTDLAFRTLNTATCESVDASYTDVNGSFLKYLLVRGSVLRTVSVTGCRHVFDKLVDSMSANNNIQDFQASSTTLTKVMWLKLSRLMPRLRRLNGCFCTAIDDYVVQEIMSHHPLLKHFGAVGCNVSERMKDMYHCLSLSVDDSDDEDEDD